MSVAKKSAKARKAPEPQKFVLPDREWHRVTELVKMFIATGWLANERPQSMMLISEPGSGKTELLDRFAVNASLQYASDLTVRGLYNVLKRARSGAITHLVATEFQKFFMRKAATADNTLGTLCQALEEGIYEVLVGEKPVNFGGAQIGFIGAITHDTMNEKNKILRETGFISRVAVFDWEMTSDELFYVMGAIGKNDKSDLTPIRMAAPEQRIRVEFPEALSRQFQVYVHEQMRGHTVLRVFKRFRALAMACAAIDGRDVVHARDVEKVVAFNIYWERMLKG